MSLTTMAIISLCLSVAAIIAAIILSVLTSVKYRKDEDDSGHHILSPLQVFTICFFLAVVIMLFPGNYATFGEKGFWGIIKSILISLQYALQVFTVNIGFDSVQSTMGSAEIGQTFSTVYTVYASVLYIVSPLLMAGFILSLFKEATSLLHYSLSLKADIYVMSDLNDKSITLAQDIMNSPDARRRRLVVFAGVDRNGDNGSLVFKAQRLGAICLKRGIAHVGLKPAKRNIYRKFYLIGEDEDQNIRQTLALFERLKKKCDNGKTEIYTFASSSESEVLLNSANTGNMKVRRVSESRNLAWQTLREVSIFDNPYIPDGKSGKQLNIVIVGCGNYGTELLKAVSWLAQMPEYSLTIHVFDKATDCEEKVKFIAPELISRSGVKREGDANYTINFYPETDVESSIFIDKLNAIEHITSIFIALGSDRLNIDTAIKVRIALRRADTYRSLQPPIYPVVYDDLRFETAQKSKSKGDKNPKVIHEIAQYGLDFIGNITKCYSVENIEHRSLEKEAEEYHLCRVYSLGDETQIEEERLKFNQCEYYRNSAIAQAIYIDYLKRLDPINKMIFTAENKLLFNEYEHRRNNAYMRAEGYVYSEQRDNAAKKYNGLKPFDELSEEEKCRDEVWNIALSK